MKKIQQLHDYLLTTNLVTAEQLRVFGIEGSGKFGFSDDPKDNICIDRQYTVQIYLHNWAGDISQLEIALVWWLQRYQASLGGQKEGYRFEAEIVNKGIINLFIFVNLSDRINYDSTKKEICNCAEPFSNPEQFSPKF